MSLVAFEEIADQVVKITLNDPDHLNAMTEAMAVDFRAVTEKLDTKKHRAVIITGAGRAFSAGGDLEMLEIKATRSQEQNAADMFEFYHSFLDIRKVNIPLIAAVNGHAIGAGLCFACACDIRIVSQAAKLGFTFTKLGLYPGMGATYFLPKVLGVARASELMLTGRVIEGEELYRSGIAAKYEEPESVLEVAKSAAYEITHCGPLATKSLVADLRDDESALQQALTLEARRQAESYSTEEFKTAIQALRKK